MENKTMPITGGCMCGAVRYEATEPPERVGYCHCRMCQKWTGNLFMLGAGFRSAAFRFTQGEQKFYQSSAWLERGFCANCGTPVCDHYLKGSDHMFAMVGSLDHPHRATHTSAGNRHGLVFHYVHLLVLAKIRHCRIDTTPSSKFRQIAPRVFDADQFVGRTASLCLTQASSVVRIGSHSRRSSPITSRRHSHDAR